MNIQPINKSHIHELPDGTLHFMMANGYYTVENNTQKYVVTLWTAKETRKFEYFTNPRIYADHRYAPSLERAVDNVILMTCRCLSNAYEKALLQRKPESAEARCSVIADKLKYTPELRKLIFGLYPSQWTNHIRIQCLKENVPALESAIAEIMDGHKDVEIEWDVLEVKPFYGVFIATMEGTESENAA